MVLVATATDPDNPNPKKGAQVIRVADITRTVQQANTLLGIAAQSANLLVKSHDIGTTVEIDPVAAEAARKTYELAHVRLRDLIDDEARWGKDDDLRPAFDKLHASQAKVHEAEALLADKQKELVAASMRPSVFLGAHVRQFALPTGEKVWVAFLGSAPHPDSVVGEGASPKEAMDAFDRAYEAKVEQPGPSLQGQLQDPPDEPPAGKPKRTRKPRTKQ